MMLNELRREAERKRSGLSDPFEDQGKRPLSEHVADFKTHLRSKSRTGRHIKQTISRVQAAVTGTGCKRLADLDSDRVSRRLADQRDSGKFGVSTVNGYVTALKMFGRCATTSRRTPANPFISLTTLNARADLRHERRTLSPEELGKLLYVTRTSDRTFRGLDGEARFCLYLLACRSGLRCSELASLTPRSFSFKTDPPTVTVGAADAKNRRSETLPIPRGVALTLRCWFDARPADQERILKIGSPADGPLWRGTWTIKAAKMIRMDLESAGIPFEDEDGRKFDFHSLRSQYVTDLARSGVPPATAQKLARHSTPVLTARSYTRLSMVDLDAAVSQLTDPISTPLAKTGTDDFTGCLLAGNSAKTCDTLRTSDESDGVSSESADPELTACLMRFESDCKSVKEVKALGLEPRTYGLKVRCSTN